MNLFETIGAPWLDAFKLAEELRALELDGVLFPPLSFTPVSSMHQGQLCQGIQLHVTDRDRFESVKTALHILRVIRHSYPTQFKWGASINRLAGSGEVPKAIHENTPSTRSWPPGPTS